MKRTAFDLLLCIFILSPITANAQNEPTFIKNEKGVYVNKEGLKMTPESYSCSIPYIKNQFFHKVAAKTILSAMSKERLKELKDSSFICTLYFDAVKGKMVYMSFQQRKLFVDKNYKMPLTDDEMKAIENAFKSLKWKFYTTIGEKVYENSFSGYSFGFSLKRLEDEVNGK
jgi:hypothetical protein